MKPDTFRKLAALGLNTDQIAGVLEIMDADAEDRKEKGRARWRKWKDNQPANVSKRLPTTANVNSQLTRGEDSSSKKDIDGKKKEDTSPSARKRADRLAADWVIPDPWLQEALNAGLTRQRALSEAERMKNWSLSAKNGAKLDWLAAWRNWYRDKVEAPQATSPPKKTTLATMWHEEARNHGILNDPPSQTDRHLDAGLPRGQDQGSGFARRIASA